MLKAYKYRIYPNEDQKVLISKHFGCCRWVYNYMLDKNIKAYQVDKTRLSRYELQPLLPGLKREEDTKWLSEVNAQSLQMVLINLDTAFSKFFKEGKGFPKFKSKNGKQTYQCFNRVSVDFISSTIKLPKLGKVNTVFSRKCEGRIKTTTISRTATDKYYVSILVQCEANIPTLSPVTNKLKCLGVDTGLKTMAVLSNGHEIENPKILKRHLDRLKVLQRRASRKVKGSNNRRKANKKVAVLHEYIANCRIDHIQKSTTKLLKENQFEAICVEDLNVSGFAKNHKLAQAFVDVSLAKFYQAIEYKCKLSGVHFVKVDRFYASTKICNYCGHKNAIDSLKIRQWNCTVCGNNNQRDYNSSLNIRDEGFRLLTGTERSGESVEPPQV